MEKRPPVAGVGMALVAVVTLATAPTKAPITVTVSLEQGVAKCKDVVVPEEVDLEKKNHDKGGGQ